ncbi:segregation and condensation protein A [Ketogulonicigenium robustum]|uniref:Segregation and condensation protein A n=1 Tax=Ketogulonicigenium robustum TaxID=92947 RepID=A0A1W6P1N8_9RHOB|nr:ScpA family protein [Ketogulonicigenium robustum]ARO15207.1 segregation and condensation protein A [Ketogulonicigenium robustum]
MSDGQPFGGAPVSDLDLRLQAEALIVDVGGFEGPLDLLLTLSRTQKVDLRQVSILALAEQYLAFIAAAKELRLELAADYLVMAAWLAFLKSRLLLPADPKAEGPSGEELAAHLAFQLERLSAIREAAAKLMARDQLGRERFVRGDPGQIQRNRTVKWYATLTDLMQAYARLRTREEFRPFALEREAVMTMDQALERMRKLIGFTGDWTEISGYLPADWRETPEKWRSSTAATFAAALQLVKEGRAELRQDSSFAPIEIRKRGAHG